MAATAAQMAAYLYPEEEDPEGAFSWWLQPCGGTDLVPDDIKKVFGILSTVADGVTSFKEPKNLRRGSGKKGDNGNPHESDRSKPSAPTAPKKTKKKCNIKKKDVSKLGGAAKNVWMKAQCINDMTHSTQYIISKFANVLSIKRNQPF